MREVCGGNKSLIVQIRMELEHLRFPEIKQEKISQLQMVLLEIVEVN